MADLKPSPATPSFAGEFRHKVEGKGRITIPAKWRFEEEVEIFLIPKSTKHCLSVLTRAELDKVKADLGDRPAQERNEILETIGRTMRQATLDKGGRITIPEEFCQKFKIAGEVWLVGAVDRFNIWNLADYEADQAVEAARGQTNLQKAGL
jgi:MraZ protein